MDVTEITEAEFVDFVVALVGRKVKGQPLASAIGNYRIDIVGVEGTYRITVSGGPLDKWTRRQGTSRHNVATVAATLYAELNRSNGEADCRAAEVAPKVQAARAAIAEAGKAQRLYGRNGIPAIKARNAASEAIYRALGAGARECDIVAA